MGAHHINIITTNNPNILKFESNLLLTEGGSYQFNNIEEAKESPLSTELFKLPFISKVFISANFIAIEKYDVVTWDDIREELREIIEIYLNQGNTIVTQNANPKKVVIEIFAESTPNPMVMKFGCNKPLTPFDIEYKSIEETTNAPLANVLFNFPFVQEVYVSDNYISITKNNLVEWQEVIGELRHFLKEYIQSGKVVVDNDVLQSNQEAAEHQNNQTPLEGTALAIAEILEEHIKPAVAGDGGNIVLKSYNEETKEVFVVLKGACSGCPSSTVTLKNGIETLLKDMLPNQISNVIAVNG